MARARFGKIVWLQQGCPGLKENGRMIFFVATFLWAFSVCGSGSAKPEYVVVRDDSLLITRPRRSIVVIYNAGTYESPDFRMRRPAVVPVDDQGKIAWFDSDSWQGDPIRATDRFFVESDMFGSRGNRKLRLVDCAPVTGEMIEAESGVAWLASCSEDILRKVDRSSTRVIYDEKNNLIRSRIYDYKFKKENNMLFDSVTLKGSSNVEVAKDSDLYIRSDVKNFFSLNFSSRDIQSQIVAKRIEPLAALASLGFYLKVLFFKITLDLRTDVAFFESSANIPMVMTLPVDASKRLNRKSGILYSFRLGDGLTKESLQRQMPLLEKNSLEGEFSQPGLAFCRGLECHYQLSVPTAGKQLKMELTMRRGLVEKGLFPWFVADIPQMKETMNWSLDSELDLSKRVGIYFEVSKLPKGSHPWDFWITF